MPHLAVEKSFHLDGLKEVTVAGSCLGDFGASDEVGYHIDPFQSLP